MDLDEEMVDALGAPSQYEECINHAYDYCVFAARARLSTLTQNLRNWELALKRVRQIRGQPEDDDCGIPKIPPPGSSLTVICQTIGRVECINVFTKGLGAYKTLKATNNAMRRLLWWANKIEQAKESGGLSIFETSRTICAFLKDRAPQPMLYYLRTIATESEAMVPGRHQIQWKDKDK